VSRRRVADNVGKRLLNDSEGGLIDSGRHIGKIVLKTGQNG